jgi:hypothetical protein
MGAMVHILAPTVETVRVKDVECQFCSCCLSLPVYSYGEYPTSYKFILCLLDRGLTGINELTRTNQKEHTMTKDEMRAIRRGVINSLLHENYVLTSHGKNSHTLHYMMDYVREFEYVNFGHEMKIYAND